MPLPPDCPPAFTAKAAFAVECIDLEAATLTEGAEWEPYQINLLNNDTPFDITDKARQVGWSFTAAMDAVCDGIVNPETPHLFVSINQDEAAEKIRYAKLIYNAIDPRYRPALTQDAGFSMGFDNGSRLISHPCRPPRGKARARIYLDEMAHYQQRLVQPIYTGALPATVRGDGYIRIGSSPLGASGLFWEIFTQTLRKWPGYDGHRQLVPWWECSVLCTDVEEALLLAPDMLTEERVRKFGTQALIIQFENNFLDDFQQEFECMWVDDAVAWLSWEMLAAIQQNDLMCWHSHSVEEALAHLPQVQQAMRANTIETVFCGGIDIGRKKDLTEFIVIGKGGLGFLPTRWIISLDNVEFRYQQSLFWHIIQSLPFTLVLIDQNGLGMQLAETLEQTGRAVGVNFTAQTKELLAVEARVQVEARKVIIPAIRDLVYQLHSIRKVPGQVINHFDTEASAKHHCYDGKTEVLTSGGWVSFSCLTLNHKLATLKNDELVFESPTEIQAMGHIGEMVRVKNKQVDLLVTPNHRMYVKNPNKGQFEFYEAGKLLEHPGRYWQYKKDANWIDGWHCPETPVGTPAEYAEFLGFYLSEGCKGTQYRVILYQNAGLIADRMIALFKAMGKTPYVSVTKRGALRIEVYWKKLHQVLPTGTARHKRIPRYVFTWSKNLQMVFFNALMDGDGSRGAKGNNWAYHTISPGLADDVMELLLYIGWAGSVVEQDNRSRPGTWTKHLLYRVNVNRTRLTPRTNKRKPSHSIQRYAGTVYCATVPYHLLYVRRNKVGVWCGNSDKFWAWALGVFAANAATRLSQEKTETVDQLPAIGLDW